MNNQFNKSFASYVCEGDTITAEVDGLTITARIERDDEQQEELLAARKAWENDEWFFCGIVLSVSKNGIELADYAASLWAIEANYPNSDNAYLTEVANELLPEAIEAGKAALESLTK